MGSQHYSCVAPTTFVCPHGTNRYLGPCETCSAEAEAERQRERARVRDPAWVIEQAVKSRRRWFDGCAFCPPSPDLVVHTIHEHDCPFRVALVAARIAYGLHLVAISDGATLSPSNGEEK